MSPPTRGQAGGGEEFVGLSPFPGCLRLCLMLAQAAVPRPQARLQMPQLLLNTEASMHHLEPITARAALSTGSG